MNDQDLQRTLSVVDDIESAPVDLADRVWNEVHATFTGEAVRAHVDVAEPSAPGSHGHWRSLTLAAATIVAVVGIGLIVQSSRQDVGPAQDADLTTVPESTSDTLPAPSSTLSPVETLDEACQRFEQQTGGFTAIEASIVDASADATDAADAAVAVGDLIEDIERITGEDATREVDQLRILRGALTTTADELDSGDRAGVQESMNVARAAAGQLAIIGSPPLDSCLS